MGGWLLRRRGVLWSTGVAPLQARTLSCFSACNAPTSNLHQPPQPTRHSANPQIRAPLEKWVADPEFDALQREVAALELEEAAANDAAQRRGT